MRGSINSASQFAHNFAFTYHFTLFSETNKASIKGWGLFIIAIFNELKVQYIQEIVTMVFFFWQMLKM